jgi:hypothetical protein
MHFDGWKAVDDVFSFSGVNLMGFSGLSEGTQAEKKPIVQFAEEGGGMVPCRLRRIV